MFIICFLLHFINSADLLSILTRSDTTQPQPHFLTSGSNVLLIVYFPETSFQQSFIDSIEGAL